MNLLKKIFGRKQSPLKKEDKFHCVLCDLDHSWDDEYCGCPLPYFTEDNESILVCSVCYDVFNLNGTEPAEEVLLLGKLMN